MIAVESNLQTVDDLQKAMLQVVATHGKTGEIRQAAKRRLVRLEACENE